ncbi:MAG: flavodoxin [Candidatus Lokiarchaeota archaeon]
MVKVLVVYYSLTGNTKMVANAIKNSINCDLLQLKPIKELNAKSGMKYFWGGFQAVMGKKPKLEPFEINPLDYNIIFIGSPVWAWREAPPIHSFLENFDLSGKNVALWMCAGGDGVKAMSRFKAALKNVTILSDICFKEPLQNNPVKIKENIVDWVEDILQNYQLVCGCKKW